MKWILIFLICVFGCIFCVVHLGSKAKRHLTNFSSDVIEDELIEDGENWTPDPNENVADNRGWTDKPDVNTNPELYTDEEYMEMHRDDSPSEIAEEANKAGGYQYQEYQVDDDNLVEDIEDDLPPLMEVEDDVEIEGDIEDLTPEEVAELELNDAQQADSEIDQEDELPPEVAEDIEWDDGFLDEEPDSYTNVDEEPAAPADSEKADEVAPHEIESFEEALHLAEEKTHNEDPPAEATKATKKKTRQGKKRTDRKRDPTKRGKGKNRSKQEKKNTEPPKRSVKNENLPDPVDEEYYINLDEMDVEFNDQDQERIVRVDS